MMEMKIKAFEFATGKFENEVVGTKCLGTLGDFLGVLAPLIEAHVPDPGATPGQLVIPLPTELLTSLLPGDRARTLDKADYHPQDWRKSMEMFMLREQGAHAEDGIAIVFTREAWCADPDFDPGDPFLEEDTTHVLVDIRAVGNHRDDVSYRRWLLNFTGGSSAWTIENAMRTLRNILPEKTVARIDQKSDEEQQAFVAGCASMLGLIQEAAGQVVEYNEAFCVVADPGGE